ncbi:MAG: hypothetical protein JXA43_03560 [Candidatus Diapherotrites archaeon]|nr:hypothetical protein [Candidatus Diapherotrites archaeon]
MDLSPVVSRKLVSDLNALSADQALFSDFALKKPIPPSFSADFLNKIAGDLGEAILDEETYGAPMTQVSYMTQWKNLLNAESAAINKSRKLSCTQKHELATPIDVTVQNITQLIAITVLENQEEFEKYPQALKDARRVLKVGLEDRKNSLNLQKRQLKALKNNSKKLRSQISINKALMAIGFFGSLAAAIPAALYFSSLTFLSIFGIAGLVLLGIFVIRGISLAKEEIQTEINANLVETEMRLDKSYMKDVLEFFKAEKR